jgi:[protein-PII] uridylyltransferase
LFTTISGALAATGLNILSARVFSRSDGIIIDTFFVVNAKTGGLAKRAERDKFSKLITQALLLDGDSEFEEQTMVKREDTEEWQLPTRIRIDTQSVESRTIVEVESEDRLGLLHRISNVLTRHDLNIHVARISTEKGAAIDTFYVRTMSGGKPTDENKLDELKRALETELG